MSPDPKGDFEIHVADMLSLGSSSDNYDVLAELKKSSEKNVVCIFGQEESIELPKEFKTAGAKTKLLSGNHHYQNDFDAVAREIYSTFK